MSRVENRLKTLGSNVSEFGNAYINFVEDKSREDFDKLLQLMELEKMILLIMRKYLYKICLKINCNF